MFNISRATAAVDMDAATFAARLVVRFPRIWFMAKLLPSDEADSFAFEGYVE